jgi:hypothetical protein
MADTPADKPNNEACRRKNIRWLTVTAAVASVPNWVDNNICINPTEANKRLAIVVGQASRQRLGGIIALFILVLFRFKIKPVVDD